MGGPNTTKNERHLKLAKYFTTQVRVLVVWVMLMNYDDFLSSRQLKAMEALNVRRIQTWLGVAVVF